MALKRIKFNKIHVDEKKQFRIQGLRIADDPKAIEKLERSIAAYGLKNPPTVEAMSCGNYELVDGFHRHAAWKRLYKQNINNPKNPWATIEVEVESFANDSERRKYKFEANRHPHGHCSPNTEGDIVNYLTREGYDPAGIFGVVNTSNKVSCDVFKDALDSWMKNEVKEWEKNKRDRVVKKVLENHGAQTTPPKIQPYVKEDAFDDMKDHFSTEWDGLKSMDLSNDKKVLCGTVSSNEHHAKPGVALGKLISEFGTGDWSQINLPEVKLVGYVVNIKSKSKLIDVRKQMQASVNRMNEFCKNNISGLNGRNMIEYYELPQLVGVETKINQVI